MKPASSDHGRLSTPAGAAGPASIYSIAGYGIMTSINAYTSKQEGLVRFMWSDRSR